MVRRVVMRPRLLSLFMQKSSARSNSRVDVFLDGFLVPPLFDKEHDILLKEVLGVLDHLEERLRAKERTSFRTERYFLLVLSVLLKEVL
jgi:hypothetical protein